METRVVFDIKGLDKLILLKSIWKSRPYESTDKPDFDEEEAKEVVKNKINSFCGKVILLDLSKDTLVFEKKNFNDEETYDIPFWNQAEHLKFICKEMKEGVDPSIFFDDEDCCDEMESR